MLIIDSLGLPCPQSKQSAHYLKELCDVWDGVNADLELR